MLETLKATGTKSMTECSEIIGDNSVDGDNQQLIESRFDSSTLGKTWVLRCLRYELLPLETVLLLGLHGPIEKSHRYSEEMLNGDWYKGTDLWQPSVHSDVAF
jgi:hypothetical protein